jgi:hypothetical protein
MGTQGHVQEAQRSGTTFEDERVKFANTRPPKHEFYRRIHVRGFSAESMSEVFPRNPRFFRGIHVRGFSAESEVFPRNPCPRFFRGIYVRGSVFRGKTSE